MEVGHALQEIRIGRLYKNEYGTFEDYCRERWGFGRNYVNKQICAADCAYRLGTIVPNIPLTEGLIRPIVNLTQDQQTKVLEEAIRTAPDGKLTASI